MATVKRAYYASWKLLASALGLHTVTKSSWRHRAVEILLTDRGEYKKEYVEDVIICLERYQTETDIVTSTSFGCCPRPIEQRQYNSNKQQMENILLVFFHRTRNELPCPTVWSAARLQLFVRVHAVCSTPTLTVLPTPLLCSCAQQWRPGWMRLHWKLALLT